MILSVGNFGNHQPEKFIKNLEICKENICGSIMDDQTIFSVVHSNFLYDSETYDLMKLNNLSKILVSSQFKLYALYSN